MAHVSEEKKQIVQQFTQLVDSYPIVGVVDMENLPAPQLQKMREKLRGRVEIVMTKKRLMRLALKAAKKEKIEKLDEFLRGMPAMIFTKDNPFSLFKTLKESKSKAPAKAGQTAPNDIKVPAGPTPFSPGPVIGELGALGIKTKVEAGKISILEEAIVCKEGEEINEKLASMLTRLSIEPMEVGLNLLAVYEEGDIFTKTILDIDQEQFIKDFSKAAQDAFNLTIEIGYITPDNKDLLIQKAYREAHAVALEAGITNESTVKDLIGKAEKQASALAQKTGDGK